MAMITLHPRFPLRSTLALAAAVLVTVGISPGAQAAGDKGRIRLQLGTVNQFAYEAYKGTDASGKEIFLPATLFQPMVLPSTKSCLMDWDTFATNYRPLVVLTPDGGATSTVNNMPGFGPTSLGVYDGKNGVPCYRVSSYANEKLHFALTNFTTGKVTDPYPDSPEANAFNRLELDVEVKKDAWLELTIKVAGAVIRTYELRSGLSIVPGVGLDSPGFDGKPAVSNPANTIMNCKARSDSGPDSGPNDNCRWVIEDLGQSFTVAARYGEFSLEGGGDFGAAADDYNSFVYLTSVKEGVLCDTSGSTPYTLTTGPLPIGTNTNEATCEVRQTSACTGPTSYVFRDFSGAANGCEFIKSPGKQFAALTKVLFPPEPRYGLDQIPPTKLVFTDGSGRTSAPFKPNLCTGTVTGEGDSRTIDPIPAAAYTEDAIPENQFVDWACILEQDVVYLGAGDFPGMMQVEQTILFWGDLQIGRW